LILWNPHHPRTCDFSAAIDMLWLAVPQCNGKAAEIHAYQTATHYTIS